MAGGAPQPASVGLILADDAELAELNADAPGQVGPTDVLSFPLLPPEAFPPHRAGRGPGRAAGGRRRRAAFLLPPGTRPHLGDIVVSVERAIGQAEAGRGGQTGDVRWSPADELRLLVVHGALHLCGWDHAEPAEEAAMRALERRPGCQVEPAPHGGAVPSRRGPVRVESGPFGDAAGRPPPRGGSVKLVVGLGNPGEQYAKTRHNIGWMVAGPPRRPRRLGRPRPDARRRGVVQGRFKGLDLVLAKPLTFMNESGIAVRKLLARERAPLHDLLVVADDFALPFGKLRFREGGSHGGHNGLRSIIDELGTETFSRLRVGIGEPGRGRGGPRPLGVRARRAAAPRRAARRRRRRRRGLGPRGRQQGGEPLQRLRAPAGRRGRVTAPPGEVDGPPGPDGVRRTRTGWRRVRPRRPE